jgi:hypothetical protein
MPKRVIDFDAMWGSDKLASCAAWAQAEYAWLYGLADASGCFEITNLRVIWGRVAAIRGNLTIERLEQVFAEFQDKGLLFVWEHEGKRYAHWTGSDVPGRLPPPSWRMRLEKFAPPVPKQRLAEYMGKFARGRAAHGCAGFRGEEPREPAPRKEDLKFEISDLREERRRGSQDPGSQLIEPRLLVSDRGEGLRGQCSDSLENLEPEGRIEHFASGQQRGAGTREGECGVEHARRELAADNRRKGRLEEAQGQDLGLDWNLNGNLNGNWEVGRDGGRGGPGDTRAFAWNTPSENNSFRTHSYSSNSNSSSDSNSNAKAPAMSQKEIAVARELRVGQGPVCGPAKVKPEVLERIRLRDAARAASKSP